MTATGDDDVSGRIARLEVRLAEHIEDTSRRYGQQIAINSERLTRIERILGELAQSLSVLTAWRSELIGASKVGRVIWLAAAVVGASILHVLESLYQWAKLGGGHP